jgi:hypothetical protein
MSGVCSIVVGYALHVFSVLRPRGLAAFIRQRAVCRRCTKAQFGSPDAMCAVTGRDTLPMYRVSHCGELVSIRSSHFPETLLLSIDLYPPHRSLSSHFSISCMHLRPPYAKACGSIAALHGASCSTGKESEGPVNRYGGRDENRQRISQGRQHDSLEASLQDVKLEMRCADRYVCVCVCMYHAFVIVLGAYYIMNGSL